jgi:biotin carboxyl carrier protein
LKVIEVTSPVHGNVWKVLVAKSSAVSAGDELAIVESMKMEFAVVAAQDSIVDELLVSEGQIVKEGEVLLRLRPRVE